MLWFLYNLSPCCIMSAILMIYSSTQKTKPVAQWHNYKFDQFYDHSASSYPDKGLPSFLIESRSTITPSSRINLVKPSFIVLLTIHILLLIAIWGWHVYIPLTRIVSVMVSHFMRTEITQKCRHVAFVHIYTPIVKGLFVAYNQSIHRNGKLYKQILCERMYRALHYTYKYWKQPSFFIRSS